MHKSQILYGTQTGNSQEVAEKLKDDIELDNDTISLSNYDMNKPLSKKSIFIS